MGIPTEPSDAAKSQDPSRFAWLVKSAPVWVPIVSVIATAAGVIVASIAALVAVRALVESSRQFEAAQQRQQVHFDEAQKRQRIHFERAQERQRIHDRLSIRPHLQLKIPQMPDSDFVGMKVRNVGPGTAYLRHMRVALDDRWHAIQGREVWGPILRPLRLYEPWVLAYYFVGEAAMAPDEEIKLFGVEQHNLTDERLDLINAALPRVAIGLCYCSAYDDCWLNYSRLGGPGAMYAHECPRAEHLDRPWPFPPTLTLHDKFHEESPAQ